jgi:hypothetical protein
MVLNMSNISQIKKTSKRERERESKNFLYKTVCVIYLSNIVFSTNLLADIGKMGDYTQILVPTFAFGMTMTEPTNEGAKQFTYSFLSTQASVYFLKYQLFQLNSPTRFSSWKIVENQ